MIAMPGIGRLTEPLGGTAVISFERCTNGSRQEHKLSRPSLVASSGSRRHRTIRFMQEIQAWAA